MDSHSMAFCFLTLVVVAIGHAAPAGAQSWRGYTARVRRKRFVRCEVVDPSVASPTVRAPVRRGPLRRSSAMWTYGSFERFRALGP